MDTVRLIFKKRETMRKYKVLVSILCISVVVLTTLMILWSYTKVELSVVLPVEKSNLYEKQTFRVFLDSIPNPQNHRVVWSVDEGVFSGQMVFIDGHFEDVVDVDGWDWKKDSSYSLAFFAYDARGTLVAQKTIAVFARAPFTATVDGNAITIIDVVKKSPAAVYESISSVTSAVPVQKNEGKTLSIVWVEGPPSGNQKFIFKVSEYADADISAFWQLRGGHRNFVFEKNQEGRYVASINISGWHWLGSGPYMLSFVIADKYDLSEIAREDFYVTWDNTGTESRIMVEQKSSKDSLNDGRIGSALTQSVPKSPIFTTGTVFPPYTADKLYVPAKPAVEKSMSPALSEKDTALVKYILSQSSAIWLNGDEHDTNVFLADIVLRSRAEQSIPTFVLYNIPNRDCGAYSSGGSGTVGSYKRWIDRLTSVLQGIEMLVIVEPDALAQLNCLSIDKRTERLDLIRYATESFSKLKNAHVYIDAGHPFWVHAVEMSERLKKAGVENARGFSLNVSNFVDTENNIRYGNYLSGLLGGKKYVIDTGRNGNGPDKSFGWCNPSGRAFGPTPSIIKKSGSALDAFLWIKFPGESDGTCNGGPSAGIWWLEYALKLFQG